MSAKTGTSSARQHRLRSYLGRLTEAAGHADRAVPLRLYCTGLLLPGERKSVEPMAARLAPENVRRMHQSLHHVVADAAWSDEALLGCTRDYALAAMTRTSPVAAWIVDDTGLPKKGTHSVGVARQYCGQTGYCADVHDWAMEFQAKQRENVTLTHISLRHGVGNWHGVDNGVTLEPA